MLGEEIRLRMSRREIRTTDIGEDLLGTHSKGQEAFPVISEGYSQSQIFGFGQGEID
jgi:hypothetical protein